MPTSLASGFPDCDWMFPRCHWMFPDWGEMFPERDCVFPKYDWTFPGCELTFPECSLYATECFLYATECSLTATECSLNAIWEALICCHTNSGVRVTLPNWLIAPWSLARDRRTESSLYSGNVGINIGRLTECSLNVPYIRLNVPWVRPLITRQGPKNWTCFWTSARRRAMLKARWSWYKSECSCIPCQRITWKSPIRHKLLREVCFSTVTISFLIPRW